VDGNISFLCHRLTHAILRKQTIFRIYSFASKREQIFIENWKRLASGRLVRSPNLEANQSGVVPKLDLDALSEDFPSHTISLRFQRYNLEDPEQHIKGILDGMRGSRR
jgi:hypothetical protein